MHSRLIEVLARCNVDSFPCNLCSENNLEEYIIKMNNLHITL